MIPIKHLTKVKLDICRDNSREGKRGYALTYASGVMIIRQ